MHCRPSATYLRTYCTLGSLRTLRTPPPHPPRPFPALQDTFTVELLRGKNAFGYEPSELEGKSILSILHPADHRAFAQTAGALLAMAVGVAGVDAPPQSVRVLHRVFFRRLGQTSSEVMVDSIITAKRPDRRSPSLTRQACRTPQATQSCGAMARADLTTPLYRLV